MFRNVESAVAVVFGTLAVMCTLVLSLPMPSNGAITKMVGGAPPAGSCKNLGLKQCEKTGTTCGGQHSSCDMSGPGPVGILTCKREAGSKNCQERSSGNIACSTEDPTKCQ